MNLMGMRFKTFTWQVNPTVLSINGSRNVREALLPYTGSHTEDLGPRKLRVAGEGYFTGEDCYETWNRLLEVYNEGGPGYLQLPGQEPFPAVMDSLKLTGAAGKNLLKYAFTFTEYQGREKDSGRGVHRAAAGESLWDYAWRWGRSMEELTAANPDLPDIGALREGEEVTVP